MKSFSLKLLLVGVLLTVVNIRCNPGAKLLKSGSPLMNSVSSVPTLSTLASLLKTPGLGDVLGPALKDNFTFLAPTNDAFAALGSEAMSALSNPANVNKLASVLKNHIVDGKYDNTSIVQFGLKNANDKTFDLAGANLGTLISDKKFNIIPVAKVLGM